MTIAFPLAWPPTLLRTPTDRREVGSFRTSLAGSLDNVSQSLTAFGRDSRIPVGGIVLSSNVSLGINRPTDPGVAAWFTWDDEQRCIAVDRYTTPAANLQAIHHVLEARRTELRHGTIHLVRATLAGLKALPAPAGRHWSQVLGLPADATPAAIEGAFRRLAKAHHPDQGGATDAMSDLNLARAAALRERGW